MEEKIKELKRVVSMKADSVYVDAKINDLERELKALQSIVSYLDVKLSNR